MKEKHYRQRDLQGSQGRCKPHVLRGWSLQPRVQRKLLDGLEVLLRFSPVKNHFSQKKKRKPVATLESPYYSSVWVRGTERESQPSSDLRPTTGLIQPHSRVMNG